MHFGLEFANYQSFNDPTMYMSEYRRVSSQTCESHIAMEQAIWINHKVGAPKTAKIYCFDRSKSIQMVNMDGDLTHVMFGNGKGYHFFGINGSMLNGKPYVEVSIVNGTLVI
ncbi:MAG: hypothetical protein ACRC6D_09145 [Aeromonas sp.]